MAPSNILVVSDSFHTLPEAVELLNTSGHRITYVHDLTPWTDLKPAALQQADAVITGRGFGINLALAPNLKVIALHTSGSDNVDLEEATRRGILVTNVKGVNAEQCAEFAMGLMLSVVRQIQTGDRAIRAGLWASKTQTSMDVYGSTLGVIGFGQIAKAFVRRAQSFGVKTLVHTRTEDPAAANHYGIQYAALDELLTNADIVCLFASLTGETRGMLGVRELAFMKPTSYLINIARGELIDEPALIAALRSGAIAGAGLDVYDGEPLFTSPLFDLDNVVLTPHQAGLTRGGKTGAALRAARNALEVLSGNVPADVINRR